MKAERIDLHVKDVGKVNEYHRLLVLTSEDLTEDVRTNFIQDATKNNINYAVFEEAHGLSPVKDSGFMLVDGNVRYYALAKGEIVGMEVGHRTGDAIRLLCNFGRKSESLDGGL